MKSSTEPVIPVVLGSSRNLIPRATSSGVVNRPRKLSVAIESQRFSCDHFCVIPVIIGPGKTVFTRMLRGPRFLATDIVNPCIPAFEAEYPEAYLTQ